MSEMLKVQQSVTNLVKYETCLNKVLVTIPTYFLKPVLLLQFALYYYFGKIYPILIKN